MGSPGGAEKLEGLRLAAVVPAPATAAGGVRAHAARVEGGALPAAREGHEEKAGPRGCADSGTGLLESRSVFLDSERLCGLAEFWVVYFRGRRKKWLQQSTLCTYLYHCSPTTNSRQKGSWPTQIQL